MQDSKKTAAGRAQRLVLLSQQLDDFESQFQSIRGAYPAGQVADDDILDAVVLALSAHRANERGSKRLPGQTQRDRYGLPMEMVYPA